MLCYVMLCYGLFGLIGDDFAYAFPAFARCVTERCTVVENDDEPQAEVQYDSGLSDVEPF